MTTATKRRVRRKVCEVPAAVEKPAERLALEAHLVHQLKTRCGRQGPSPCAPSLGSLQDTYAFSARALDELGLVGTRRISCWVLDSFASLCGRFMMLAREEHEEHGTPMRFRTVLGLHRFELWADGKLVATTKNSYLALNWLVMKTQGRSALHLPLHPGKPRLP